MSPMSANCVPSLIDDLFWSDWSGADQIGADWS